MWRSHGHNAVAELDNAQVTGVVGKEAPPSGIDQDWSLLLYAAWDRLA